MKYLAQKKKLFFFITSLLALFFSGCKTSVKENIVRLPFLDIQSLNPIYWQPQHILAQGTTYEGLFTYHPDSNSIGGVRVVPAICDTFWSSSDGLVWTFKLRKDKKWSNGDPVTAHDFEWSFKYFTSTNFPDMPLWASPCGVLKNGWTIKTGALPPDSLGIKALDDTTLEMTLAAPRFDMDCQLVIGGAVPVHRPTCEKFPDTWWRPENAVTNGPYIVKNWTTGKECVLIKNHNYVGYCGNVDKIILYFTTVSYTFGLQAFQAGEIDYALINNVGEYKYVSKSKRLASFMKEEISDLDWIGYQLARNQDTLLDNKKLRQAFAYAIDKKVLVDRILGGRAIPVDAFYPKDSPIGKHLNGFEFNVDRAKQLLAEAGYPDGKGLPRLYFYISGAGNPVAEYIVQEWKKNLGIDVILENVEAGMHGSKYMWGCCEPDVKPGFTNMAAGMNGFSPDGLLKNAGSYFRTYGFPASVRKDMYHISKEAKVQDKREKKGDKQSDWDELVAIRNELLPKYKKILESEPDGLYKDEIQRRPFYYEQFDAVHKKAKETNDNDLKKQLWQQAISIIRSHQQFQIEYIGKYPEALHGTRLNFDISSMDFETAIKKAPEMLNLFLDQAYQIPLYLNKIQYVKSPELDGLVIYRFSWGPIPFNFKFMNIASSTKR